MFAARGTIFTALITTSILGLVCVAQSRLGPNSALAEQSGPSLSLHSTERNLGAVSAGEPLRARFRIENRGGRRLIINQLLTSCCDSPPGIAEPTVVPPFQTVPLDVSTQAPTDAGPFDWDIEFTSNDPNNTHFSLKIFGAAE